MKEILFFLSYLILLIIIGLLKMINILQSEIWVSVFLIGFVLIFPLAKYLFFYRKKNGNYLQD